jgi:hypothetical protein
MAALRRLFSSSRTLSPGSIGREIRRRQGACADRRLRLESGGGKKRRGCLDAAAAMAGTARPSDGGWTRQRRWQAATGAAGRCSTRECARARRRRRAGGEMEEDALTQGLVGGGADDGAHVRGEDLFESIYSL